jgi:hypothetical protein
MACSGTALAFSVMACNVYLVLDRPPCILSFSTSVQIPRRVLQGAGWGLREQIVNL